MNKQKKYYLENQLNTFKINNLKSLKDWNWEYINLLDQKWMNKYYSLIKHLNENNVIVVSSPEVLGKDIIEVGAGDGSLAQRILKNFSLWSRLGLKYHIVETSPKLSLIQRETLRDRKCIIWHERMEDALSECSGNTLIISNELVDAFPVELIQWSKDQ